MEVHRSSEVLTRKVALFLQYMKEMDNLDVGFSMPIPLSKMEPSMVSALCRAKTEQGKKVFVYIRHEGTYEVARVDPSFVPEILDYMDELRTADNSTQEVIDGCIYRIKEFLSTFYTKEISEIAKTANYTAEMRAENAIPYAYIQRQFSSTAPFKHYKNGSTEAIKLALNFLEKDGVISLMNEKETTLLFDTKMKMYRILVN